MKTLEEKIAVMQHFANGGEIECLISATEKWRIVSLPVWNWANIDYRIKEVVDPYAELKAAAVDPTKQLRIKGEDTWCDAGTSWCFIYPLEDYEIRNKPTGVKLLAYLNYDNLVWYRESALTGGAPDYWKRVPSEDKIVEVEE